MPRPGHAGGQELLLLGRVRPRPHVDVVGVEGHPRELRVGVGVLQRQPSAGQDADTARTGEAGEGLSVAGRGEPGGGHRQRVRPGRRDEHSGLVPDQRRGQPVGLGRVGERPPALVAVPLLVDGRILASQPARDPAAPDVGALPAAGGAVLAHARHRHQVEGPGPEPVSGAGERADRAHLHGVAGEVGVERLAFGGADDLAGAALHEIDEHVPGDLLGGPRAPGARDAALAVEQHLGGDGDRLGEGPLVAR